MDGRVEESREAHTAARAGGSLPIDLGHDRLARPATAALAILLAAGLAVRFYGLGAQSFWLDELWTAVASDPALPLGRWLRYWVLPDVHPPLHLLVARAWQVVLGAGEVELRLLSAVLSAGTVGAVFLVQRWTPIVRQPLALAAWFACSVGVVFYAQDARPYALLLLMATIATLLSVAIAYRMERGEPVRRPMLALAAVVVVAEYSHYFGVLAGGGLFGALFLFAAWRHRRHLRLVTLTGAAALVALLPWLVFHVRHLDGVLGGNFWISNEWLWHTFPEAAAMAAGTPALFLLAAAAVAAALVARPRLLGEPACCIPLAAMVLMVLGALTISLHTPVITNRNLLILVPPFYVLTIFVLGELAADTRASRRAVGTLAPVFLVATSLGFAVHQLATYQNQQWREAAAYIAGLSECRDSTLQVFFWRTELYAYYLPPPYRHNVRTVLLSADSPPAERLAYPDDACPLILWSAHMDGEQLVQDAVDLLGMERGDVVAYRTHANLLILDRDRLAAAGRSGR
jgi:4-amino-4-deoxy-L-arabinose transferase-like glycosyltransferase